MKVVFLIGFLPNPRIKKRIDLAKKHADVSLLCWDRGQNMLEVPNIEGIQTIKSDVVAGNDPIKRLIPYKKFSNKARKNLDIIQPDIIHVQGLDMLRIACAYKRKYKNTKVIYEVADVHRLISDKQTKLINRIVQRYLMYSDKKLCKTMDLLIVTSEQYYDSYFSEFVPLKKYFYFPNVPDLKNFANYEEKKVGDPFTVGYIGIIRYKDQIKMLLEVANRLNIKLIFAGYEDDNNEIEMICKDNPNIAWYGRFDFTQMAAKLYSQCDAIYSVYDADLANCRIALPNKLYESIYCRLPIIVAKDTYLSEVVNKWGVGISVSHKNIDELERALKKLQKKEVIDEIKNKCIECRDKVDLDEYNKELVNRIEKL